MSDLPFLEQEPVDEVVPPEVVEEPQPVEPVDEQPRDEAGRFVLKEEARPEPVMVPLAALQETRDKVRDLEARLAQTNAPQQPAVPDMFEDPEGFQAYTAQLAQSATLNAKLDISEELARDKFGDEVVDKAKDWALAQFQTRPGFQQEVLSQRNPYRYAVEAFQREQIASTVDLSEYEQFKAWKAAQAQVQQPVVEQPAAPPPPRSLASIPSSGGATHVPTGPGQAFDQLFAN